MKGKVIEPQKPDDISQEDWNSADIPELTDEEFARLRPFREVYEERGRSGLYGSH